MMIRPIQPGDNQDIEAIIRNCLIEFGGNRAGLAWEDESLSHLSDYYHREGRAYWVALDDSGKMLGGCGIAEFGSLEGGVCELQKMYLLPEARGTGLAPSLLEHALRFAGQHYRTCYLETLQSMQAANRFYVKHGFQALEAPLAGSEHYSCDAWYIRDVRRASER
ncbi:GNAT family N-acetyltransferase [Paenibacillus sp. PR3]|uniref:GNAT family N-acetyltransferase n=1 Tax=Paenibacillus terricola TaxID=2763503 RepID=A0ABR8MYY6_9BACL|nr:GNAT family N-acetyltransferase [Paenibacillus terricola]MBD3921163.1 GNAT family N-acetyltransferase [Paenibacillus terricola]